MVGYWGLVASIGILNRIFVVLIQWVHKRQPGSSTTSGSIYLRRLKLWARRYLSTPALFNYHAAQPIGWCTVPPRIQSITIITWVALNIILSCIGYDLWGDNFLFVFISLSCSRTFTNSAFSWRTNGRQLWQYLSDRTGIMSMANMPLMWAFAVRNNVLLWLTGWSFSTYSQFHRWIARVATVQAIIHSVGYTVIELYGTGRRHLLLGI